MGGMEVDFGLEKGLGVGQGIGPGIWLAWDRNLERGISLIKL